MGETVAFFINIKHETFSYKDGSEIIEIGIPALPFKKSTNKRRLSPFYSVKVDIH
jgi:hypothetical protein